MKVRWKRGWEQKWYEGDLETFIDRALSVTHSEGTVEQLREEIDNLRKAFARAMIVHDLSVITDIVGWYGDVEVLKEKK